MNLSELKPARGARKDRKRIGRGGSRGTTSGKGGKGQTARSGGGKGRGFEGGQTPWYRRLPKFRGFKSLNQEKYQVINLSQLAGFDQSAPVTPELMKEKGIINNVDAPVKLLARGEVKGKYLVKVHATSKKAKEMVEAAGGNVEVIG